VAGDDGTRVGARTYAGYAAHVKLHIVPSLGPHRLQNLGPLHIETALADWAKCGRRDGKNGQLSQRTIAHLFNTLRTLCKWAMRSGLLVRNPLDGVQAPRVERKEMRALGASEIAQLVAATGGTDVEFPVAVAVGTGLRRGELLALKWSDVDFETSRLSVRRSVETVGGVTRTKPPKTASSARTISLPAFVVAALKRCQENQNDRRDRLGLGTLRDDAWVFTRGDDTAWEPGAFSLAFARLVKRKKLPHVRFHDLRHSFGTLAVACGVDLKTVSSALGHSAISTTANIYLHAVDSLQRDAACRIDAMLGVAVGDALAASGERASAGLLRSSVPQRCHATALATNQARGYGLQDIAPTGVEPVSQP